MEEDARPHCCTTLEGDGVAIGAHNIAWLEFCRRIWLRVLGQTVLSTAFLLSGCPEEPPSKMGKGAHFKRFRAHQQEHVAKQRHLE